MRAAGGRTDRAESASGDSCAIPATLRSATSSADTRWLAPTWPALPSGSSPPPRLQPAGTGPGGELAVTRLDQHEGQAAQSGLENLDLKVSEHSTYEPPLDRACRDRQLEGDLRRRQIAQYAELAVPERLYWHGGTPSPVPRWPAGREFRRSGRHARCAAGRGAFGAAERLRPGVGTGHLCRMAQRGMRRALRGGTAGIVPAG